MLNILFFVPYVPNLIRIRPYNLIRSLSARGHRITLMTIWKDEQERKSLERIQEYCEDVHSFHLPGWRSLWNCLSAMPTRQPLQSVYSWEPELANEIVRLAKGNGRSKCDVVHVEHLRGARYGAYLKTQLQNHNPGLPVIWDSVDSISLLFRQAMLQSKSVISRSLTRFELQRTEPYEAGLVAQFDRVVVTSSADKHAFQSLPAAPSHSRFISVLPNGVDLDYFRPDQRVQREPATLVVSGKMSYHANVTMVLKLVEEIMPHVWRRRPDVKIFIVGKDPPRRIQSLSQNPNIVVTGTVGDLRPYLQKATIAMAPIVYGAGIQNKVLEAMACATPVIASPQATSALSVTTGQELMIATDSVCFADSILALLDDPERRERLGRGGRDYVEKNHQWFSIAGQLEQIYDQAIGSFAGSPIQNYVG
jgi:sugar transferase (PEP-CTERM/EpsH1 system associated)